MGNSAMKYKYSKIQKVFTIWEILFTVAWFVNSVLYIKWSDWFEKTNAQKNNVVKIIDAVRRKLCFVTV